MTGEAHLWEKEAHEHLTQEKYEEAYKLFKKAAESFRAEANHKQSALCFASAASCWSIKSGEKTFSNAAKSYEEAAKQAEKSGDLEYASLLYKYAAICFERDMEPLNFSDCFYRSKECYRRFLFLSILHPKKAHHIAGSERQIGPKSFIRSLLMYLALTFSFLIWGHGERPVRTFYTGITLIFLCAFFYTQGTLIGGGLPFKPDISQSLYLSVTTFTTVGYGDIAPVGILRLAAMAEAFCGVFLVSLFAIGLSRKYLRA